MGRPAEVMAKSGVKARCPWCPVGDTVYERYHDEEWGVPECDGHRLFEMLNLEGAQAGLSWRTVLGRRDGYRTVFEGFEPKKLLRWDEGKIQNALQNPGIIRNRLKVRAVLKNASAMEEHFGGDWERFSKFLWSFAEQPIRQNAFSELSEYPSRTEASDRMSKELKKRGFTFVGSTICYAFMQAVGMVNDHSVACFRREPVKKVGAKFFGKM